MINLLLQPDATMSAPKAQLYRVAGKSCMANLPLAELAPFGVGSLASAQRQPRGHLVTRSGNWTLVYRGPGWIGSQWHQVECWSGKSAFRLAVDGAGLFHVSRSGRAIAHIAVERDGQHDAVSECVLGPALALALALRGTWCLHASAVVTPHGAIALLGESGSGKSTLAAFLGAVGTWGWRRIADDALPVALAPDRVDALPHFPQLKLPLDQQPSLGTPERMALRAIYVLSRPDAAQVAAHIECLSPRGALLALVRHTVAACLFDEGLQAQHLEFCARTVTRLPVRSLCYPRGFDSLPCVREVILADLEAM